MMKTMMMSDVVDLIPQLGYAEKHAKNLTGSVNKSADAYDDDLHRINADLGSFDRKWGRGRIHSVPKGFKTASQFRTWRKNVRAVLAKIAGHRPQSVLTDDWKVFIAFVIENQGKGKLVGANSNQTIETVAREASRQGVPPQGLTDGWIDEAAIQLSSDKRKSFVRGVKGINRVIDRCDPSMLEGMLVTEPLSLPRELRPKPSSWRRSAGNPDATLVWSEFDAIMHYKQYGDAEEVIEGTPPDITDSTVEAYRSSFDWLLGQLLALDYLEPGMDLREIITHANLVAALNSWIKYRTGRGLPSDKSTLHVHTSRLALIALNHLDISPKEAARFRELRKKKAVRTASVGKMSAARLKWIQEFDRDRAMQARAHRLPETLMERSKKILSRVDEGRKVRKSEHMMALRMGIAAAQIGILSRASPVRATNLRELRLRGKNAELLCTNLLADPRLAELRIVIAGDQVKNDEGIDEFADDDLAPIVRWYLSEIRPRLIEAHPFSKNYKDTEYLFPSTSGEPMERTGFNRNFRDGLREVGFDMEMHQARHMSAYFILSVDPNGWDDAAALLRIDVNTLRRHYGWIDQRRASAAGREKLREARKRANRHHKGTF